MAIGKCVHLSCRLWGNWS